MKIFIGIVALLALVIIIMSLMNGLTNRAVVFGVILIALIEVFIIIGARRR